MARRSTNTFEEKRRRFTHTARILRCGGWGRDADALYDAGDAIAGGRNDWLIDSDYVEELAYTVCRFATAEQAAAMTA